MLDFLKMFVGFAKYAWRTLLVPALLFMLYVDPTIGVVTLIAGAIALAWGSSLKRSRLRKAGGTPWPRLAHEALHCAVTCGVFAYVVWRSDHVAERFALAVIIVACTLIILRALETMFAWEAMMSAARKKREDYKKFSRDFNTIREEQ